MTKQEATQQGTLDGAATFAIGHRAGLYALTVDCDFDTLRASAAELALVRSQPIPIKQSFAYQQAFVDSFVKAARDAYWEMPEVKAAMRLRAANRWVENRLERFAAAREKFVARLSENALYAMEWSDDMFKAAADNQVALVIRELLGAEKGSVEGAVDYARQQALRGARNPKSSTSACSNLADRCQTAAWAEFVDDMRYE